MVWEPVAILTFLPALAQERFAQLPTSAELKKPTTIAVCIAPHLAAVRPRGCLAWLMACFVFLLSPFSRETPVSVCVCLACGFPSLSLALDDGQTLVREPLSQPLLPDHKSLLAFI